MSDPIMSQETERAIYGLGFFVISWSVLEATLEVAIAKQLGLGPKDGSHITAGMQFKPKAVMLKSLLNRDKTKNAGAIATVDKVMQRGERNDALHSVIGWDERGLVLNRRRNDSGTFTSKEKPYTGVQFITVALEIAGLSGDLKSALGISDVDYVNWLQEAHKEANKSE